MLSTQCLFSSVRGERCCCTQIVSQCSWCTRLSHVWAALAQKRAVQGCPSVRRCAQCQGAENSTEVALGCSQSHLAGERQSAAEGCSGSAVFTQFRLGKGQRQTREQAAAVSCRLTGFPLQNPAWEWSNKQHWGTAGLQGSQGEGKQQGC